MYCHTKIIWSQVVDIEPEEIVSVSVQSSESSSQRVVPLRQRFNLLGGGRPRPRLVINRDKLTRPTISDAGVAASATTTTTTTRRPIINRSRSVTVSGVLRKNSWVLGAHEVRLIFANLN